jgi:hypothetical protein
VVGGKLWSRSHQSLSLRDARATDTFPRHLLLHEISQPIFRMGESRTELIAWVNEVLQVNYTKVEQCGTGGAYCQIMDSIYGEFEHRTELLGADVYNRAFQATYQCRGLR